MVPCDAHAWAVANFEGADLGDRRRKKKAHETGGRHG